MKGRYESFHGGDPEDSFNHAITALHTAAKTSTAPDDHRNLALAYSDLGSYQYSKGADPSAAFLAALDATDRTIELNPDYSLPYFLRGFSLWGLAGHAIRVKEDPEPFFDQAVASYAHGLTIPPENAPAHAEIANILQMRAGWELDQDLSPVDTLDAAFSWVDQGLEINSNLSTLYLMRGQLKLLEGRWLMIASASPKASFEESRSALETAIEKLPDEAANFRALAELHASRAEWLGEPDRPCEEEAEQGLAATAKALEIDPNLAAALAVRAQLLLLKSKAAPDENARSDLWALARAAMEHALELNPMIRSERPSLITELDMEQEEPETGDPKKPLSKRSGPSGSVVG
jgi:tetratricopeptide (TPR) repeat protein